MLASLAASTFMTAGNLIELFVIQCWVAMGAYCLFVSDLSFNAIEALDPGLLALNKNIQRL